MKRIYEMPVGSAPFPNNEGETVLNPLEQLAMEYAGKWRFITNESPKGWGLTRSFVRLETNSGEDRLHCDYAVFGLDQTRRQILLRRALAVLAIEERRIYSMTDEEAILELSLLKSSDTEHVLIDEKPL